MLRSLNITVRFSKQVKIGNLVGLPSRQGKEMNSGKKRVERKFPSEDFFILTGLAKVLLVKKVKAESFQRD